jgi:trehalose 6-phosphate phosphatase
MLAALVEVEPERVAVLCDYDGTLAPIVDRPADAVPVPGAGDALARLASMLGLVAVVSGRPVEFLRIRLDVDGVVLVGHYGLERLVGDTITLDPRVADYADALEMARREAEATWSELLIEDKGVAFTVHWRSNPARAVGAEVRELARRFGLDAQPGRMACEVRPPIDVDKGSAVAALVSGFEGAAFLGDDRGDLPAFVALDMVPVSLRVGVHSVEAPAELTQVVDLTVDGPDGAVALLVELAEAFAQRSAAS